MTKRPSVEARASLVLRQSGITTPPIPVEVVARRLGLQVSPASLGDDVSGVLVVQEGRGVIGYNSAHSPVRQRFSVAHEIGHYVLHRKASQLFIDKEYFAVFRDTHSSTGESRREREANAFAAALLMPTALLRLEIERQGLHLADEATLDSLAGLFRVSRQAMAYRLANLGIFPLQIAL